MALYGGIDLHAITRVIVLLDEQDRVIHHKRVANQLSVVLDPLAAYRGEITGLVVESTYH